jgi:hypothetical protein
VTNDETTFVEWQSNYETADDASVGDLRNPIYRALLNVLRAHFA